ncbi:MAG: WD40 repeat domain-containing protein, partial [Pseudanabaena sp.]
PDLRSFKFWDISETPNFYRFQFINTSLSFGGYDFWFYPCLAISPDAQKLAIYNGFDIELWDLSSGRFLDSFFLADEIDRHYDLEKPLLRISFISNKKLIFELILGDSYLFYTWKYMYEYNRRCLNYLGISRFPESCPILSFCHDRSLFLVMNYNLQIISLTKIKSNTPLEIDNNIPNYYDEYNETKYLEFQVVREIKIDNVLPTCLNVSQTGSFLVVGYSDGIIRFYDAGTGELIRCFSKHSSSVKSVAISPDCRSIASVGESVDLETNIKVWDTVTGELNANLTNSTGAINSLLFSPDSTKLAASSDSQVTLFALKPEPSEPIVYMDDDDVPF